MNMVLWESQNAVSHYLLNLHVYNNILLWKTVLCTSLNDTNKVILSQDFPLLTLHFSQNGQFMLKKKKNNNNAPVGCRTACVVLEAGQDIKFYIPCLAKRALIILATAKPSLVLSSIFLLQKQIKQNTSIVICLFQENQKVNALITQSDMLLFYISCR